MSTPVFQTHFEVAADLYGRFDKAQRYIDSECIRRMNKYTPMRSKKLIQSVTDGTVIGFGLLLYNSPYARFQYYGRVMVSPTTGSAWARRGEKKVLTNRPLRYDLSRHHQAQSFWFEKMKTEHKAAILRGAAAASGARACP